MKRHLIYLISFTVALIVVLVGCSKKPELELEVHEITMTTKSVSLVISASGTGSVTIDWGDGTPKETHKLTVSLYSKYFSHSYSETIEHNIKLTGNNIETFYISGLTTLDVSKNTKLRYLTCDRGNLTILDVSKNTELTDLYCKNNQLTSLDVS